MNGDGSQRQAQLARPSDNRVPLEAVIRTAELSRRGSRPADHEAENHALASLMREMTNSPSNVLQKLVEIALRLCAAHSAGVSILEEERGRKFFRWQAVAGRWAPFLGGTMPRETSPCGTVLEHNCSLLLAHPQRHYPIPPELTPPIVEVLLVPFHIGGEPVGTIWALAHDESRQFDGEDQRLLTSLGQFASTAYQLLAAHERKTRELAAMQRMQEISTRLIQVGDEETLYQHFLDAVMTIMNSDFASMQMLHSERGELRLLAHKGFTPEAAAFWEWVRLDSDSTCGKALRNGQRVIVADVETCEFMAGTEDLTTYLQTGIRAVQSTPLFSRGGRMLGMISTHWRNPHRPNEWNLRLLDTLARQAADLLERAQSEEELRAADRRKDEFLATLAHELRNPLAPIRIALELLRQAKGDGELVEQSHHILERQLSQLVRLVDDLLDVSRITRGKIHLRKEPIELAVVVRNALETTRPLLEASAHELTLTLPEASIVVDADPARLAQVFTNLLTNAAKYTEPGGRIWLSAEVRDGEVRISVRDTGIGISAEHLPRIFEMFSQVAPALERSQGGLGVGLALARGLVELHGGSIEAHSGGAGQGSEFIVHLPVVAGPVKASAEPSSNSQAFRCGAKYRILVVDDNRDAAVSLETLLQLLGHETYTVHDGLAAVRAAEAFRPDVMLLDIGLPKMNGYEAARRIRAEPWGQNMLLIAVSGWGQEGDKRQAREAGFDRHITKPVDPAALTEWLAGLCWPRSEVAEEADGWDKSRSLL